MLEQFNVIPTHPNYSISNTGRIMNSRGREKVLNDHSKDGYLQVDLYNSGIRETKRVHRLVAEAFIPNPDHKPDVNHIDGNKRNNSADNLEWVTKSENMLHAYSTGLTKAPCSRGMLGKKNPNAGRKGRKVRIVETGEEFDSVKECAIAIDGNDRCICDCLNGVQYTHRNYHFEDV